MNTLYLAAICAVLPGLRRSTIQQLIQKLGDAKTIFEASESDLLATGLVEPKNVIQFISKRSLKLPEKIEKFCMLNSVSLISIYDEVYPKGMKGVFC